MQATRVEQMWAGRRYKLHGRMDTLSVYCDPEEYAPELHKILVRQEDERPAYSGSGAVLVEG